MQALRPGTAAVARFGVLVCAAAGLYLGGSKGWSTVSSSTPETAAEGEHVAAAKAVSALPAAPTFDEAAIRKIAKEEAQNLVSKAQVATAATARRKAAAASAPEYSTPSDAGLVYARPPRDGDAAAAPPAPGPVPQF